MSDDLDLNIHEYHHVNHREGCRYSAACNGHTWFCNKCGAGGKCSSCDDEKAALTDEIGRLRAALDAKNAEFRRMEDAWRTQVNKLR